MKRFGLVALMATLPLFLISARAAAATWSEPSSYKEGFLTANGVRLQYLDWGGNGPALIFIHGAGQGNPHIFDDLAPAFADCFRVIAYARRGAGRSDAKGPYDTVTLTDDLRGLMDALGIAKADLVGHSSGGNEISLMAAKHPERVDRIVYLDAAYDWADPDFETAFEALPPSLSLDPPSSAMASFDAYRAYEKAMTFTTLDDMNRVEAYLRETVLVLPDGRVKPRIPKDVSDASISFVLKDRRNYTDIQSPALAIYPESFLGAPVLDSKRREDVLSWERKYMSPFQAKSIARVRKELKGVEIVKVPGDHEDFFLTSKNQVVSAMRRFLSKPMPCQ